MSTKKESLLDNEYAQQLISAGIIDSHDLDQEEAEFRRFSSVLRMWTDGITSRREAEDRLLDCVAENANEILEELYPELLEKVGGNFTKAFEIRDLIAVNLVAHLLEPDQIREYKEELN